MYDKASKIINTSEELGKELLIKAKKAFQSVERYNAQKTWYLLSEFVLPSQHRGWFEDVTKGIRRDRRVFDSTAVQANRDLASAMHSTITNPTMKWSKFKFKDDGLNHDDIGKVWLQTAADVFHDTLNESNFDMQMGKCYLSLSALGQFILFQDEDFKFQAWHLAEVAWLTNYDGRVDTIYRKFKLSLKQAVDKFGDALGEEVLARAEKDPGQEYVFFHCVTPRDKDKISLNDMGLAANAKERPFACYYIMEKGSKVVLEEGYYEFPVYVAKWSNLPGEDYGFGPGQVALSDIRTLNKIMEENLKGLAKAINPPMMVSSQNMISGDFRPSGLTVVRNIEGIKEFVTQSRFDVAEQRMQVLQASIKSGFYIDKLLLPPRTETGEMTAYEVAQRLEQMQQILGPVLSRLDDEFLQPFVVRSLGILRRRNKIPPLPPTVANKMPKDARGQSVLSYEVKFVNSLARSQQLSEMRNVQQWLQENAGLVQFKPEIMDNIDTDALVDYTAEIRDIPTKLVVNKGKVAQIRADRQKAQQAQQAAALGEQGSKAVKNMAQAHQAVQTGNAAGKTDGGGS